MFIDEKNRVGSASRTSCSDRARLPWLAPLPSSASELVCVGKIKSNGVSQSLFIDRSEWPPKTSQQHGGPPARPHQTRAAAVIAAAAVAAAGPKVICISPVGNHKRSHTVIRRAVTSARHHHYHHQQRQNQDVVHERKEKTGNGEARVGEVMSTGVCMQHNTDAAMSVARLTSSKRTFEQTEDYDSRQLRLQLRSAANAKAKAARIVDADRPTAVPSSTTSTVLPGSSVLLPEWALKGSSDGRHQLRPLLPRGVDMPSACAVTNVITIIPTVAPLSTLCKKPDASSVMNSPNKSSSSTAAESPLIASGLESSAATSRVAQVLPAVAATCTSECLDRSAASQSAECRSATHRNEPADGSRSQWLQRIRLIECEMTPADNAATSSPPFYINVVPLQTSANDRKPSQRVGTEAMTPDRRAEADSGDEDDQPPAQMLEALRLVRKPSSRASTTTSTSQHHPASASVSAAASRLVTMKLVSRSTK